MKREKRSSCFGSSLRLLTCMVLNTPSRLQVWGTGVTGKRTENIDSDLARKGALLPNTCSDPKGLKSRFES